MHTLRSLACVVTVFGWLFASASTFAAETPASAETDRLAASLEEKASTIGSHLLSGFKENSAVLPGIGLAEGVSEITGVAISPMLGISAVGAWKYWHTEASARASLPWYCQPWAWGTGLTLIGICLFKDLFGAAVPGILKKPLDWIELFENKASALVASAAFVPLVALAMSDYERIQPDQANAVLTGSGLAVAPLANVIHASLQSPWVTVPLSLALFGVIWLTSHAIHVLIALSPFSLVDSGLKLMKLSVLALLTGCAAMIHTVSPVPAMVVCGIIALVSLLLARWSFRLLVFGSVMVTDLLFGKNTESGDVREQGLRAFLARPLQGIPARSRGRLEIDATSGQVWFVRRPWLILPVKKIALPVDGLVMCKGLLYPSLGQRHTPDSKVRRLCLLLPRYRGVELSIATRLRCTETLDSALVRGFKAARQWFIDVTSSAAGTESKLSS
ncbi:hypothetical protein [Brevifollis gellanilyticus]|uniref:Uncharacterized protein n=1 Tax=Brevifollis gellanilyticus TaxID=748831 RepID=A0A512MDQ1_9BACT|nr:hypothetical protein [Brevifollis gellanilyticus]GEP44865.1 hypothetical protein BGE01nite_41560 [Brevifollis gellanilyticus]